VGGNAFYCSARGDFRRNEVALNEDSRTAAREVYRAISQAFEAGFFPAAPAKDACEHCDFRVNCGPYERERVARKESARLEPLLKLRRLV
jgi:CRISPR/Cas system-associated exonuclease Cas4 (RecB family)